MTRLVIKGPRYAKLKQVIHLRIPVNSIKAGAKESLVGIIIHHKKVGALQGCFEKYGCYRVR